jgi:hypothetical protein
MRIGEVSQLIAGERSVAQVSRYAERRHNVDRLAYPVGIDELQQRLRRMTGRH